jgi:hypothetical protein
MSLQTKQFFWLFVDSVASPAPHVVTTSVEHGASGTVLAGPLPSSTTQCTPVVSATASPPLLLWMGAMCVAVKDILSTAAPSLLFPSLLKMQEAVPSVVRCCWAMFRESPLLCRAERVVGGPGVFATW